MAEGGRSQRTIVASKRESERRHMDDMEGCGKGSGRPIMGGAAAGNMREPIRCGRWTYGAAAEVTEPDHGTKDMMLAVAKTPWQRFLGLMGQREIPQGCGLVFDRCRSIHMFFMRIPLDIVWMRKASAPYTYVVTDVSEGVRPWRLAFAPSGTWATACMEVAAGCAPAIGSVVHMGGIA